MHGVKHVLAVFSLVFIDDICVNYKGSRTYLAGRLVMIPEKSLVILTHVVQCVA